MQPNTTVPIQAVIHSSVIPVLDTAMNTEYSVSANTITPVAQNVLPMTQPNGRQSEKHIYSNIPTVSVALHRASLCLPRWFITRSQSISSLICSWLIATLSHCAGHATTLDTQRRAEGMTNMERTTAASLGAGASATLVAPTTLERAGQHDCLKLQVGQRSRTVPALTYDTCESVRLETRMNTSIGGVTSLQHSSHRTARGERFSSAKVTTMGGL